MNEVSLLLHKIMAKVRIVMWVQGVPVLHWGSARGLCSQLLYGEKEKEKKKKLKTEQYSKSGHLTCNKHKTEQGFLVFLSFSKSIL